MADAAGSPPLSPPPAPPQDTTDGSTSTPPPPLDDGAAYVDHDVQVFASIDAEDTPYREAKLIYEHALSLPPDAVVSAGNIKDAFTLVHPAVIQKALDFLVSKDLMCPSCDERSRHQTYFILFRPARSEPESEESVVPSPATSPAPLRSPPRKKRRTPNAPEQETAGALSPQSSLPYADSTPAVIHMPAAAVAPTCGVGDAARDLVLQRLCGLFAAGGEDMATLSALRAALRADGVSQERLSDADIEDVLRYLSDLNRVMVDDSGGGDKDIYQI